MSHSFRCPQGSKLCSLLGHNRGLDLGPGLEELTVQGEELDGLIAGNHRVGWAVLLEYLVHQRDSDEGGDSAWVVKADFTEEVILQLSHERIRGEGEEFGSLPRHSGNL